MVVASLIKEIRRLVYLSHQQGWDDAVKHFRQTQTVADLRYRDTESKRQVALIEHNLTRDVQLIKDDPIF